MTDAPVILVTRIVAYLSAAVGALAFIPLITDYFERGIWPLLTWYVVAGAAIGARLMPIGRQLDGLVGGLDAVVKPRIRASLIDLGVVFGIAVVGGYLVVLISGELDQWALPLLILLLLVMAVMIGVLVGMLVIAPLGMLVGAGVRALSGKPFPGYAAAIAVMLLTVVAFAIVGGLSVGGNASVPGWLVQAYQGIVVMLTGIPNGDLHVVSQPLAWVARGLAALLVAEVLLVRWVGRSSGRAAAIED